MGDGTNDEKAGTQQPRAHTKSTDNVSHTGPQCSSCLSALLLYVLLCLRAALHGWLAAVCLTTWTPPAAAVVAVRLRGVTAPSVTAAPPAAAIPRRLTWSVRLFGWQRKGGQRPVGRARPARRLRRSGCPHSSREERSSNTHSKADTRNRRKFAVHSDWYTVWMVLRACTAGLPRGAFLPAHACSCHWD